MNGRHAVAALLILLLAAGLVADLHLAIVFSPLLVLAALIGGDRRIERAIIEFVHRLATRRPPRRCAPRAASGGRLSGPRVAAGIASLGSRAPPRLLF
jgi:hypothetical protein